jgi:hypothetical protein
MPGWIMHGSFGQYFPVLFIGIWFFITMLLGLQSGWFYLMRKYPDQRDAGESLATFRGKSAQMGPGVSMSGILTLEVLRKGLRLKMFRLFGPFESPILIPWNEISVKRGRSFGFPFAKLRFGSGGWFSRLRISADLADDLWRSSGELWPEKGSAPPIPTKASVAKKYFQRWIVMTIIASAFFIIVPRVVMSARSGGVGHESLPSVAVAVLFPATVFGIVNFAMCFQEMHGRKKADEGRLYRE